MNKNFFGLILIIGLALAISGCGKKETLVMGFVPSQDSANIETNVEPLAEKLSEELDAEVDVKVMQNYTGLVEALGSDQVQIAFIPAFGYVLASQEYDAEVILKSVRDDSGSYRAQYVVRADSDIESLEDLEGKVWAYSDAGSTAGYLFPAKQMLDEFHLDSASELESDFFDEVVSAGGHDTAAIAVLDGDADVATTFEDVRDNLVDDYPDIYDELEVIEYTDEIPNDTISVPKDLDEDLKEDIKEAFLSFNDDPDMIDVMHEVYTWDGITEAEDSEYDVVRETYEQFKDVIEEDQE